MAPKYICKVINVQLLKAFVENIRPRAVLRMRLEKNGSWVLIL